MSTLSKDQIKEIDIKTTDDIKNAIKDMFGKVVQEIMEAELDTHLGYEKYYKENKNTMNRRNRTSYKTLRSSRLWRNPTSCPS